MFKLVLFLISSLFWFYVAFFGSHKFDNPVESFVTWMILSFITGVIIFIDGKGGGNPWDDPFF